MTSRGDIARSIHPFAWQSHFPTGFIQKNTLSIAASCIFFIPRLQFFIVPVKEKVGFDDCLSAMF
jgi:hypothetical protein